MLGTCTDQEQWNLSPLPEQVAAFQPWLTKAWTAAASHYTESGKLERHFLPDSLSPQHWDPRQLQGRCQALVTEGAWTWLQSAATLLRICSRQFLLKLIAGACITQLPVTAVCTSEVLIVTGIKNAPSLCVVPQFSQFPHLLSTSHSASGNLICT